MYGPYPAHFRPYRNFYGTSGPYFPDHPTAKPSFGEITSPASVTNRKLGISSPITSLSSVTLEKPPPPQANSPHTYAHSHIHVHIPSHGLTRSRTRPRKQSRATHAHLSLRTHACMNSHLCAHITHSRKHLLMGIYHPHSHSQAIHKYAHMSHSQHIATPARKQKGRFLPLPRNLRKPPSRHLFHLK